MRTSPIASVVLFVVLASGPPSNTNAQPAPTAAGSDAALRDAIRGEPGEAEHYEALGRAQLKRRDFAGAIATYQALVERVPAYTRGRYRLAFTLRKAGRLDEAAAAYRAYVAAASDDPDGYFGLARTLEKLDRPAEAREAYARYVEIETRPSEAKWVERARARIVEIDAARATPDPPATAAATPTRAPTPPAPASPPPPAGAGAPVASPGELLADSPIDRSAAAADPDAAFAEGRYAEAAAGYLARVEARPDAVGLHYKAAVSAALAGDPVTARRAALAAARTNPGWAPPERVSRIMSAEIVRVRSPQEPGAAQAMRDGRLRTAARLALDAEAADDSGPDQASLNWIRGRALARSGRYDEALDALKQAAARYPADPNLWAELSIVSARRGDAAAAQRFLAIAAAVAPGGHPLGGAPRRDAQPTSVEGP